MIGLTILLIAFAYVWVARRVVILLPNRKLKYLVIAIFILIPTWDVVPQKIYLYHLCTSEAGLKTYRTVNDVDGYLVEGGAAGIGALESLTQYGYKFLEESSGGKLFRYRLNENGKLEKRAVANSAARYAIRYVSQDLRWNTRKAQEFVIDTQTNQKLADWITFYQGGNWLQRIGNPYLGGNESCEQIPPQRQLYLQTLKPTKAN